MQQVFELSLSFAAEVGLYVLKISTILLSLRKIYKINKSQIESEIYKSHLQQSLYHTTPYMAYGISNYQNC